ncbi:MAG: polysaccharide biosynthesis C-terminal domain-containing protein [Saprospiraceae bacterium]|nr:polysaccharide biosynthesis C-terminal domain-containing protein [Saprospiraceae bacterium]
MQNIGFYFQHISIDTYKQSFVAASYNFAKHQHKVIIWSGILELICNILLSYWWMHIWGMYGLALATVVAYFIQKAILIVYNRTYNGIPFSSYIEMKYYLIYSMLSILPYIYLLDFCMTFTTAYSILSEKLMTVYDSREASIIARYILEDVFNATFWSERK